MSELSNETKNNREPSQADVLKNAIDDVFNKHQDSIDRGGLVRQFEETIILDAPATFSEAPTATRLRVVRPIPGQEKEALEKWSTFGGTRITIIENPGQGHIQTDYSIQETAVLKRQTVEYPSDRIPLNSENHSGDYHDRRSKELLGDALSLVAMDGISRAQEVKRRNQGEEADPDSVTELVSWLATAEVAELSQ